MKNWFKLLIILSFAVLTSCSEDKVEAKIQDFSKKQTFFLRPNKLKPYAMLKISVKGQVNDTIRISYDLHGETFFSLTKKMDTLLVQTDYYGEGPVKIVFDPYKATNGQIEIFAHL